MDKRLSLILALGATLCASLSLPAVAQSDLHQRTFDHVWRKVKWDYFDPALGGADWDKARERYAPRVAKVKTDQELYDLLQQMLGEINESHFKISPPQEESPKGGIGIDLRIISGQAVIMRIEPESAAARAGIRPGFVVKQVNQTTVEQVFERFARSKESAAKKHLRATRALLAEIEGKPATSVRIVYLNERDQTREATLEREEVKDVSLLRFESKRLETGIGYIRFNAFDKATRADIRTAIGSMSDAPGIILDLRGNEGGTIYDIVSVAGLLESKGISLGSMEGRRGSAKLEVSPNPSSYKGPVVILSLTRRLSEFEKTSSEHSN